jgi:hypothetical protein
VPVCSGLSADDLGTVPAKNSYVTLTNTAGNASYFLKYKRDNSDVGQTVTTEDGVIAMRPDADPVGYYSQLGFYELGHVTDRGQATIYKLDVDVRLKNREGWHNYLATERVDNLNIDFGGFTAGLPFISFMTGSSETYTYRILNFTVAPWQGRGWLQIDLQSIVGSSSIWKSVMVPESFMNGEPMHITIRTVLTEITSSSETYNVILEINGKGAGLCYLTGNRNSTAGSRCQGFVVYQTMGTNNQTMARSHAFPYVEASNLVMSRLETIEAAPPTAYITADIHDTSADLTVHTGVDYE